MNFKTLLFSFTFALYCSVLFAQTRLQIADEAFDNQEYSTALHAYNKVFEGKLKNDVRKKIAYKIGESYRHMGRLNDALLWYEESRKLGYEEPHLFYKEAKIFMHLEDYEKATLKVNEFLNFMPNDKDALKLKDNIKFAQQAQNQTSIYTIQNITSLNSEYSEYGITKVKNKIIFTSSRIESSTENIYSFDGQGFSDYYETSYNVNEKTWDNPIKITALSTPFNEGSFSFAEKTQTAYFTQCNGKTGKNEHCSIYESTLDAQGNWTAPKKIITPIIENYDMLHPSISSDGQYLYFASKLENGKGGSDIWMLTKRGTQWEQLTNLSEAINTPYDEMFPVIFQDSILYFSSKGHTGYGELDIFYSVKKDGEWKNAINLKAPFNSSADDFYLSFSMPDKSEGFFSSNRMGGKGSDDLYHFFLTPIYLTVKGNITDLDGLSPLKNVLVVISDPTGNSDTTYTDSKGNYSFDLIKNKNYKINVSQPGYFGDSKKLSTENEIYSKEFSKNTGYNYDFVIKKIPKEEIKIEDIYYDYNSYTLRETSKPNLDKLVKLLEDTPDAKIQINAHTDERGQANYNLTLSEDRAKSVVEYLTSKSIDPARLSFKGWGSTTPVIKNATTEEEHQLNRRTTFKVIN